MRTTPKTLAAGLGTSCVLVACCALLLVAAGGALTFDGWRAPHAGPDAAARDIRLQPQVRGAAPRMATVLAARTRDAARPAPALPSPRLSASAGARPAPGRNPLPRPRPRSQGVVLRTPAPSRPLAEAPATAPVAEAPVAPGPAAQTPTSGEPSVAPLTTAGEAQHSDTREPAQAPAPAGRPLTGPLVTTVGQVTRQLADGVAQALGGPRPAPNAQR